MASPIFLSQPSPSLSPSGILRGVQLGFLGIYRALQNKNLGLFRRGSRGIKHNDIYIIMKDILSIEIVRWIIELVLKIVSLTLYKYTGYDYNESFQFFQKRVVNVNLALVTFAKLLRPGFSDHFLLASLHYFDSTTTPPTTYYQNLMDLDTLKYTTSEEHNFYSTYTVRILYKYGLVTKNSISGTGLNYINRYSSLVIYNCIIYMISCIPQKYSSFCISLLLFQNFINISGVTIAILLALAFLNLPTSYSITVIMSFNECRFLMYELLTPYFDRIRFTKLEREQWVKNREGILFGFAICFDLLMHHMSYGGLFVLRLSELSLAYLIIKLSDPPPTSQSQLINWTTSQIIWNKEKESHVLTGDFVNDEGFASIPGSYILI